MTKTIFSVYVEGKTWNGYTAEYRYEFDHLPTKTEVKQSAGDFESYEIVNVFKCTTTTIQENVELAPDTITT